MVATSELVKEDISKSDLFALEEYLSGISSRRIFSILKFKLSVQRRKVKEIKDLYNRVLSKKIITYSKYKLIQLPHVPPCLQKNPLDLNEVSEVEYNYVENIVTDYYYSQTGLISNCNHIDNMIRQRRADNKKQRISKRYKFIGACVTVVGVILTALMFYYEFLAPK